MKGFIEVHHACRKKEDIVIEDVIVNVNSIRYIYRNNKDTNKTVLHFGLIDDDYEQSIDTDIVEVIESYEEIKAKIEEATK